MFKKTLSAHFHPFQGINSRPIKKLFLVTVQRSGGFFPQLSLLLLYFSFLNYRIIELSRLEGTGKRLDRPLAFLLDVTTMNFCFMKLNLEP